MKVLRYSAVAAVAIFAAACGDKVTVAGPTAVTLTSTTTTTTTTTPVAPGKINSIAVAPAAVTLTIGQAVTLVAAVNADPGIATTVTWSSSDATKASVSTAGLVTALAATPGVAICATSTVNVGVKGCASAVVVATATTVPATVSIAGVYGSTTTTPINPASVTGSVSAMVNIDPGTETISKVYLKIGSVVADSQVFSAAQSAALRNAVETANEAGAQAAGENMANATSSILLTANTKAYNATTGAVTYANGTAALSVVLYVSTTARSTATYSNNLTLNNSDVAYATYTYPSTKVNASDAAGYSWTGLGGVLAVGVVPVLYSGKTLSSATIKFPNMSVITAATYCDATSSQTLCSTLTNTDTLVTKTVTASAAFSTNFALWDREFTGTLASPQTPTISMVFTDGSSLADSDFANASTIAIRLDNKGPANVTLSAVVSNGSLDYLRGNVSFGYRTSAAGDTTKLITALGADAGVSSGATITDLRGTTVTVYRNAGGVATITDTVQTFTVNHGMTADISTLSETGKYCFRVTQSDALGNAAVNINDSRILTSAKIASTCATANGKLYAAMDKTLPVVTWASTSFAVGDTAVASVAQDALVVFTVTDNNPVTAAGAHTATVGSSIKVCYTAVASSVIAAGATINSLGTALCAARVGYGLFPGGTANAISTTTTKFAQEAVSAAGMYKFDVSHRDLAGNVSTTLVKYVLVDATDPSATVASVAATTLGVASSVAGYANDNLDVRAYTIDGKATNGSTPLNAAWSSANARLAFLFESEPTVVNASLAALSTTRFLNVALAGSTGTLQHIAPLLLAASGGGMVGGTLDQTGHSTAATALANFPTKFRYSVYDQVGRKYSYADYTAPSISDAVAGVEAGSRYALLGNGFISAADSTAVGTGATPGTKGATTATVHAAISAATATAAHLQAIPLKMSVTSYKYADRTGNVVRTATWATLNNVCAGVLNTSNVQIINSSSSESIMSLAGALANAAVPFATPAPTVHVYAPIAGGTTWAYAAALTQASTSTATGSAGYCDDQITRVFTGTWNVTTRLPATQWMNGPLQFVVIGDAGQATVVRGPTVVFP